MKTLAMMLESLHGLIQEVHYGSSLEAEEAKLVVRGLTHDSRQVIAGGIFVAVKGDKADGHDFIDQALKLGARVIIAERFSETLPEQSLSTITRVLVQDSRQALALLAAAWFGDPGKELELVGITGTNGKTTCTWLLEQICNAAGCHYGVIGTVNYRYTVHGRQTVLQDAPLTTPDPLRLQELLRLMADAGVSRVFMEVSSHALEQYRLGGLLFDAVLFTNLSRDHLDNHGTMEQYFSAKSKLFLEHLAPTGTAVLVEEGDNPEYPWVKKLQELMPAGIETVLCGCSSRCDVQMTDIVQDVNGTRCMCIYHRGEEEQFSCQSALTGQFNVLNMAAAIGVCRALNFSTASIAQGLASITGVPGRMQRITLGCCMELFPAVFVDYAHTPDALENVLTTLEALRQQKGKEQPGRLICVMGCGGDRDRGKRPEMGKVAGLLADLVIVTSDNPRGEEPQAIIEDILPGVEQAGKKRLVLADMLSQGEAGQGEGYLSLPDRAQAIHFACALAGPDDMVLLAGKGHETYQRKGEKTLFFDDRYAALDGLLCWNDLRIELALVSCGGRQVAGNTGGIFRNIVTDSRTLQKDDVFLALRGEHFDGHDFLGQAIARKAGALIVEHLPEGLEIPPSMPVFQVEDTLYALGLLAQWRRRLMGDRVRLLALTGSSGKTTTKEMCAAIFAAAYEQVREKEGKSPILKTQGNFNNWVGMPLSLLPVQAHHRVIILEMGMNDFGEIQHLSRMAEPDIACITNVQSAHTEKLGSIEGVAKAKGELFATLSSEAIRVVNNDDVRIRALAEQYSGPSLYFSANQESGQKNDVFVSAVQDRGEYGSQFILHIGAQSAEVNLPAPGQHNISNALAAATMAHAAGVSLPTIIRGLESWQAPDKRMLIIALPGSLQIVNDCYNANPSSMEAALRTVARFGQGGKHLAFLGDMLELGKETHAGHAHIGRLVAQLGYDFLALTGEFAGISAEAAQAAGMPPEQMKYFADPEEMASWLIPHIDQGVYGEGDWILVKGSRGMRMERLLTEIERTFLYED